MTDQPSNQHRCGFVAVAGRPNVGKSTLVNRVVGHELCIVTPKSQTTRNRIAAIHTLPDAQMILLDTPGIHEAGTPLNRAMVAAAVKTLADADVGLFITVPSEKIHEDDRRVMELLEASGIPSVLAINKIDTVEPASLLPVIDAYSRAHHFEEIIPVSALHGVGVDELVRILVRLLPPGPPLYPEDDASDLPVRFFVAEIIREQVTKLTGQEIPYKTAVVVEAFKERQRPLLIQADIHIERGSQKKILIGKGGEMIKRIGIAARKKIEEFLERPVRLELFVKVTPKWTRDPDKLKEFGYEL
ncbi:MAG: GTPase Era [Deltaproteobacteria bacterium]